MSIKKIFLTGLAVIAFGSLAMAQAEKPDQPSSRRQMKRHGAMNRGGGHGFEMGRPGGMRGETGMINFENLNLTDAQKQRIQAIRESARNSREANKNQFEEFGKLMRLKREGLLTTEQGTRLNALQVQMQTQIRADMEKQRNDILAVLTPDQKVLLGQRGDKDRQGERRMRGRMPGRPDGQPTGGAGTPPTEN